MTPRPDPVQAPAWSGAPDQIAAFQRSAFELMKAGTEASFSFWSALLGQNPPRR